MENKTFSWDLSERVCNLFNAHESEAVTLGAERVIHYTEFFKRKKKYSSNYLKMAHAFAYHLENRSIKIFPEEIIVGTHTENRLGAICQPELAGSFMLEDLFRFEKRKVNPIQVPKGKKWKLFSAMLFWNTKSLAFKAFPFWKRIKYILGQLNAVKYIINEAGGIAHFLPNYEKIIQHGTSGLKNEIKNRLNSNDLSQNQIEFLQSQIIVLEALENFAKRFRQLAKKIGRDDIVKLLENSPEKPSSSLVEAIQTIWFFQMLIQIESLDQGISLGRIDQYLYPIYLSEKKSGTFDEIKFKDTLCAFCLKLSEIFPLFSERITEYFGGFPIGQALTLGGIDKNGKDSSNELTEIFLDVLEKLQTRQPNWHVRISSKSNTIYKKRAYDILKNGNGSPAIYNDDVIIPALELRGFPKDRTWNYATVGCVEPALSGESITSSDAAIFNLALPLEYVLGEGKRLRSSIFSSRIIHSKKLKNINSFDDLLQEFNKTLKKLISDLKEDLDYIEIANAKFHPTPFSSVTVSGCVEKAKDLTNGGALFNASGIQGVGLADLTDSLYAISELVFKRKEYTLGDFALACKNNFNGFEKLRAKILQIPKYGNDHKPVDELARDLAFTFNEYISENQNTREGKWMPGLYSMTCHRAFGKRMPALPSGRLAGESLSNGIAPSDGSDRLGPTAMFHSITTIDHKLFANGVNLNVKFDSNIVNENPEIVESLIDGYFQSGGMQIQVNILSIETLQDAILHPEKHKNLIVRISGYCSYFVDLSPEMQTEILNRTMQKTK